MFKHIVLALGGLLVAALAASCGSSDPTAIRLRISYDPAWHLDGFRVAAREAEQMSEVSEVVTLLVPDAWDGERVAVELIGLHAGEARAYGGVEVVPERGHEVTVDLVMVRIPCGDWCTEGATTCAGDGVSICRLDADDCTAWSAPVACGPAAPYCSLGECRAECVDECAAGESRCDGPDAVSMCGQADSDPCLDWTPAVRCAGIETCSNGDCRLACEDECQLGDAVCAGDAVAGCGDLNIDGCLEWGPPAPCAGAEVCDQGACASGCTDDCADNECTGLWYRDCGQYDFDVCHDLSPGTSCVPEDLCEEGLCTSAGCASTDRTCDEPPASECIDDETLRVYEAIGICVPGDGCEYEAADIACTNCPDCDVCSGISCDEPPDAECIDDDTLLTFIGPGTCVDGGCDYESAETDCPNGCWQGECSEMAVSAGGTHAWDPLESTCRHASLSIL